MHPPVSMRRDLFEELLINIDTLFRTAHARINNCGLVRLAGLHVADRDLGAALWIEVAVRIFRGTHID
ncbi:MAG: hypothetical protein Q9183_007279, partial [Haloplaca sp. 2 TL-2023]